MTMTRIAAIVAAATLGAGAFTGAAGALAADDTPGPSASDSGPSRGMDRGMDQERDQRGPGGHGPGGHGPGGHRLGEHGPGVRAFEGRMLHSEGVVESADGTFVTVRMQTGEVTAVSATSLTVTSSDGFASTYTLNDATVVERDGEDATPQVGDTVHVRAEVTGSNAIAEHVYALSPEKAKELEERRASMQEWMSERPATGRA